MSTNAKKDVSSVGQLLEPYRQQLDQINHTLVDLLAWRMEICRVIARVKSTHEIPMMQPQRVTSTLETVRTLAPLRQLNPEYLAQIFTLIIKETCDEEQRLMDALVQTGLGSEPCGS